MNQSIDLTKGTVVKHVLWYFLTISLAVFSFLCLADVLEIHRTTWWYFLIHVSTLIPLQSDLPFRLFQAPKRSTAMFSSRMPIARPPVDRIQLFRALIERKAPLDAVGDGRDRKRPRQRTRMWISRRWRWKKRVTNCAPVYARLLQIKRKIDGDQRVLLADFEKLGQEIEEKSKELHCFSNKISQLRAQLVKKKESLHSWWFWGENIMLKDLPA